jgi:hypothetical protein
MSERIVIPTDLGEPGRAMYREVLTDLDDGLVFDALELDRLHRAARLEDRRAQIAAEIDARGLWVATPKGEVPNPMILRESAIEKVITSITAGLRLSRPEPKTRHLSRAQRNVIRDVQAGRRAS